MATLNREQLRARLIKGEIGPAYLMFGAETYLRDIAARTIAGRSFGEGDFRDFNETSFSAADTDALQQALAAAEQLPMMSRRRVVWLRDIRITATGAGDTLSEDSYAALQRYLERPAESTVLIFVADELNGTRRLAKLLKEKTVAVEFVSLSDSDLEKWAREKLRELGSDIDERSLARLVELVGPDARRLTNEVKKLSTAALPGKRIDAELIESLVPDSRRLSNFELTDHLVAGRARQALTTLKKILDDGAEPVMLIGLLSYNFRRLLIIKDLIDSGAPREVAAREANLRFSDQEKLFAAARRSDQKRLAAIVTRLAEVDLGLKSSGGGDRLARASIEALACEILVSPG